MSDYKEMYLTTVRAGEEVINTLIAAQQRCEEICLAAEEGERAEI